MPIHVHHREIAVQPHLLVEAALPPLAVPLDPVARRAHLALPVPAFGRPEIAAPIAAVANEFQKSRVRDRHPGNAKRFQLDPVRPLFVVEMKPGVSRRAERKLAPGHLDVTVQGDLPCVVPLQRVRVAERLPRIVKRFRMHVLVEEHQLHEIEKPLVVRLPFEARQHALENAILIFERGRKARQRQIPARVVLDLRGIVERVGTLEQALRERLVGAQPQAPALLEPGDVPQLPQHGIDDRELWTEQLRTLEVAGEEPGAPPGIAQLLRQRFGKHGRVQT